MASADVLIPERLTGSVVLAALDQSGTSVARLVYEALRAGILAVDAYDPEAKLRIDEASVATDLGVSRTPVREALARLAHEGLVRIVPRRGAYIVRKSKSEIIELIIGWAALESMAARLTCARASDEEIRSLRTLFSDFGDGQIRSHLDEYSTANLRFHQRIIELAQSEVIAGMAEGVLVHVRAIRRHTIGEEDRPERSIVDHMHIIEALESRDADLADRLVREHALNLARHVDRTWPDEPGDAAPKPHP